MNAIGNFFSFLVLLVVSAAATLLKGYIVLSLGGLYELGFITQFSLGQMFGILWIIALVRFKNKTSKEKTDVSDEILKGFVDMFSSAATFLVSWGLGFFFHWLFFVH